MRSFLVKLVVVVFCTGPAAAELGPADRGLPIDEGAPASCQQNMSDLDIKSEGLSRRDALNAEGPRMERSLEDMLYLADNYPEEVHRIELPELRRLWRWLREEDRDGDRFKLLETLLEAGYQPDIPGQRMDGLLQDYVGMLLERNRPAEAMRRAAQIISADKLIEMRVDGRFSPLWDKKAFDARTRPREAAERERRHWEAEAKKHPESLRIVLYHMQSLRALGKPEAAIERGISVLESPGSYDDSEEYRLWVLNELAYALMDAGRTKDADARLKPLTERSVRHEPNLVSQLINYGALLNRIGAHERALKAVAKVTRNVSPYGRKWVDSVKACAHSRLGDTEKAESALARLKTDADENYGALSRALVCLNRIDEAAQLAVARLRDSDHRGSMLMALQSYRKRPTVSSVDEEMRERWSKVRDHPDVLAEARKHGRLLSIDLYRVYWGDY